MVLAALARRRPHVRAGRARARRRLEDHRVPAPRRQRRDRRTRPRSTRSGTRRARRNGPTCCSPSPPTAGASARRGACTRRPARCPTTRGWPSDADGPRRHRVGGFDGRAAADPATLDRRRRPDARSRADALAGDQSVGAGRRRRAEAGSSSRGTRSSFPSTQDGRAAHRRRGGRGAMRHVGCWPALRPSRARRGRARAHAHSHGHGARAARPRRRRRRTPARVAWTNCTAPVACRRAGASRWPAGDPQEGTRGLRQARVLPVSRGEGRVVPARQPRSPRAAVPRWPAWATITPPSTSPSRS